MRMLAIAAAVFALAVTTVHAQPAPQLPTRHDAELYVRGWIDGAAPAGWQATWIRCSPIATAWLCVAAASNGAATRCASALVRGTGFQGPMRHARCPAGKAPA